MNGKHRKPSPKPKKTAKKGETTKNATPRSPHASTKKHRGQKPQKTSVLASFKQKLQGSKFRWLNEQLYTSTSQSSCSLIEQNPQYFEQYHAGYREQTKSWPVRPVDRAIQWLKSNPSARTIADLGCGDAQISRTPSLSDRITHNFDLSQNRYNNVTVCNIADVPLPNASVDACIFCLSLMGTDYGSFLEEAARILRNGGHLWIAEVTSRAVQRTERFNVVPDLVAAVEGLGFSCTSSTKVVEGSYFFELVFVKKSDRKSGAKQRAEFPKLRACAYKKR